MIEDKNHLLAKFVSIARPERCILLMLALILDAMVPTSVATTNCFLQQAFSFNSFYEKKKKYIKYEICLMMCT